MDDKIPNSRTTPLKPPLKWPGGKRWLVPHLLALWGKSGQPRLVEPFCGGLAVALGLQPQQALLNDINAHNITFYRWLQKGLKTNLTMENDKTLYYEHRDHFNHLIRTKRHTTQKASALFYYLNRTGYNGLCRFNKQGEYNVPFGSHKCIRYTRDFGAYRTPLDGWVFSNADFADIDLHKDDFVYADPPYDVQFRQYSAPGFEWDDQIRLVDWLAKHKGPVVLSNQATPRVIKLYRKAGYKLTFFDGPRFISCKSDRKPVKEVLALKL